MLQPMINTWVTELQHLSPPVNIAAWATKPYILSQALRRVCGKLTVKLLTQKHAQAMPDEYQRLNCLSQPALVREVFLMGDDQPLTYGRVVVPEQTYLKHQQEFDQLGERPIGENLLYHHPEVSREFFEYIHLGETHPLSQTISKQLPENFPGGELWGRRSIFNLQGDPLLVVEIYLPSLPAYVAP